MRTPTSRTELRRLLASLVSPPEPDRARVLARGHEPPGHPWLSHPRIQGIGIGRKIVAGRRTRTLALRVYVDVKRPLAELKDAAVNRKLRIPGSRRHAVTDVIPIGKMQLHLNTDRVRPVVPGYAIESAGKLGTLGCVVRRKGDDGWYFLASGHVIGLGGNASIGQPIIQPAIRHHGSTSDRIGQTDLPPDILFLDGYPNLDDCALGRFDDPALAEPYVRLIGRPKGFSSTIRERMLIQKTGFTTDYTTGRVRDTTFCVALNYPVPGGGTRRAGFRELVLCDRYADEGDSGAAIFDESQNLVGLHLCGSDSRSAFSRIGFAVTRYGLVIP